MPSKRTLIIGGLAAAIGGWSYLSRRATIQSAKVVSLSKGSPPTAWITWGYNGGTLPLSVIIDLIAVNGASGSATTDGETNEVIIPLSLAFTGPYTITATATYRLLGMPNTTVRTFEGTISF